MALPTGLIPVYAFVLTLGISVPTTLIAVLFHRTSDASFSEALRPALLGAGCFYLVGVIVIWAITGSGSLWGIAAALLTTGAVAAMVLVALPLTVGQQLFRYVRPSYSEVALRYTTYGWPLAMLVVLGIFLAPGGVSEGHLFHLGGESVCLAGHCGIPALLAVTVMIELVVAVLGPGLLGLLIYSTGTKGNGQQARS